MTCEYCEYEVCDITICLCICHGHPEEEITIDSNAQRGNLNLSRMM